jgi:hypothetical protein
MKGPVDPSEPMFPFRPDEPVCQYYMKHGTCKFGQACKFNHPPPTALSSSRINGSPMVLNDGPNNDMLWNPGSESGVPMLPQRPDEPNCIYFLKNGRCKYGSTCRYHHPLNYHDRKPGVADDGGRHRMQANQGHGDSVIQPKLHYVSLPPGTYQQGHFVVADGQLAFLSLDGSSQGQVISVAPQSGNQDGPMVFTTSKASPLNRDVQSSTSSTSIASSYESSNIGSGGSLNTFNVVEQTPHGRSQIVPPGRALVVQNSHSGDNSLPRVVSTSNASDGSTVYYDANSVRSSRSAQSSGQSGPGGNSTSWKGQRSSSFEHTRQGMTHVSSQDAIHESASVPSFGSSQDDQGHSRSYQQLDAQRSAMMRGRPPPGSRPRKPRQNGVQVDDGLSMMTSALLTMLDTPEEADYHDPSQSSTPLMGNQYPYRREARNVPMQNSYNVGAAEYMPQPGSYYEHEQDKSIGMPVHQYDATYTHGQDSERVQRWSPTWQGPEQQFGGGTLQHASQSVASQRTPDSSHDSSNVGLYLP